MTRGLVFDIQHYAVHDGPGIRTTVFLAGCPLRCPWCCNPESQFFGPQVRRASSRCVACLRCVGSCSHQAIRADHGAPVIDRKVCQECRTFDCVRGCFEGALEVSASWMTVEEAFLRVAADEAFYRNSGGGMTLSGGEPLAQAQFARELLARCQGAAIHTAVETCGQVPLDVVMDVAPLVDMFFFDVKLADPDAHERCLGVSNDRIVANLKALAAEHAHKMIVRVPVVPGMTDSEANARGIADLVADAGIGRVELRAYHGMGAYKYQELGLEYPLEGTPAFLPPEALPRFAEPFLQRGIHTFSGEVAF